MAETLTIISQASVAAYTQITLRWPEHQSAPRPGQYLHTCLNTGRNTESSLILWPMLGTQAGRVQTLSQRPCPGTSLELCSVQGQPVDSFLDPAQQNFVPLDIAILANGLGLAPLIHLCDELRGKSHRVLALYEVNPVKKGKSPAFRPRPSRFMPTGLPHGVIGAIPLLEDWGIPSRLASPSGLPGCYDGTLDDLFNITSLISIQNANKIIAFGDADFLHRMGAVCSLNAQVETRT
jgi:dihydroorotate dehydrogenase electron transfer subunit